MNRFIKPIALWVFLWLFCLGSMNQATAQRLDLQEANYPIMAEYRAEAYLANNTYSQNQDNAGKGIKLYYTPNEYAVLLDYEVSVKTGFNAGLYQLSNGRYVIAFGGTTAKELGGSKIGNGIDLFQDVIADLNLLNAEKINDQPNQALDYVSQLGEQYPFTLDTLALTGHSLGGGLAQHVSYNTNFKAVTFNTAPFPFPYNPLFDKTKPVDIVNIMSNKDELTSMLTAFEDAENGGHDPSLPSHSSDLLAPISELLLEHDISDYLEILASGVLAAGVGEKVKPLRTVILASLSRGGLLEHSDFLAKTLNFYIALQALKQKNIQVAVSNLKDAFQLNGGIYNRLILGERHILDTNTGHSMIGMLSAAYSIINRTGLSRLAQSNPEFYSYIDGSFINDIPPLPANSDISQNLSARVLYYLYKTVRPKLEDKAGLYYSLIQGVIVDQARANAFADRWLSVDALAAQAIVSVQNAVSDNPNGLTEAEKLRVAKAILDSGKGEVLSAILTDEQAEYLSVIEACMIEVPWIPSIGGLISQTINDIPEKIVNCVGGKGIRPLTDSLMSPRETFP